MLFLVWGALMPWWSTIPPRTPAIGGPPFPRPPKAAFHLLESAFECRDSSLFPAEQRFMEDFSVEARGNPERCTSRLTPMTPHPGALTALGSGPNGHGGEIDIHPQQRVVEAVAGRGPIALQIIPGHLLELGDVFCCTGPQGPRHGGLLGTPCTPTGPLHRTIGTDRAIILGDGLGTTEDPAQGIEPCVDRTRADGFLPDLYVFSHGGKETVPPQILASGTQTGTPRGHGHMLAHGALLAARGTCLSLTL